MQRNLDSLSATIRYATEFAAQVSPGDVITLRGDLGVGKTAFAKAFINACCGKEIEVPSPTFTLVQTYEMPRFTIWHFDLYRLEEGKEAIELGIEDAFIDGVSLIEWPEIIEELLPSSRVDLYFSYDEEEGSRLVEMVKRGK